MEELLKMAYMNFINDKELIQSKSGKMIDKALIMSGEKLEKLQPILNEDLYDEIYDSVMAGIEKVQETAFIVGFAYCAKFLTNGKIDLFPND